MCVCVGGEGYVCACEGPWFTSIQEDGLELRVILLSFQTDFNLVNAPVVCAILESISGLERSSAITEPKYLMLVTVSSFTQFTLISVLMPLVLFVISLWRLQHNH